MGNAQATPSSNPRFPMASRAFTKQELEDLKSLFDSLAAQSQSRGKFISSPIFQGYFRINGKIGVRLFDLITQEKNDGMLTYEDLVVAKATYEKGTRDEIEEFIYQLCDIDGDGIVERSDLEAVLGSVYDIMFSTQHDQPCISSHQNTIEAFVNVAKSSKEVKGTESSMSLVDFKNWCRVLPSVRKFLGSLLMPPDSGRSGFQVPHLHHEETLSYDFANFKERICLANWRSPFSTGVGGMEASIPQCNQWIEFQHFYGQYFQWRWTDCTCDKGC